MVTVEVGRLYSLSMRDGAEPADALASTPVTLLTPSRWSREGLVRSGANPERVRVWPHGVRNDVFAPAAKDLRLRLRHDFGFEGFVFLHVGAMTPNKGVKPLLKAFAAVAARHPEARLVLKGSDSLYGSSRFLAGVLQTSLTPAEKTLIEPRLLYTGEPMSFLEIANLYKAVDAYVTPYQAEGFNMPALEALASGLPLICTGGGSTDDFVNDEVAMRVRAELRTVEDAIGLFVNPAHLEEQMARVIEDPSIGARARTAGPCHVARGWTWRHAVDRLLEVIGEPIA
jgi:glycosyltransferase involved in cell wall biosynthesis